jgi:hypothetical protein
MDIGLKNVVSQAQDYKLSNSQIVWTTELVNKWDYEEEHGMQHTLPSPYSNNVIGFRKANLKFRLTEEEEAEFSKCATDIVYFVEKYCKTMTDEGVKNIKLFPHQKKVLIELQKNRFVVWLSPRQSAKTTTSAFFIVWYNLFNYERNSLVIANKEMTAHEILDKIYIIYKDIPFFLKPGLISANMGAIKFDNGCRIVSQATTPNAGRSFTVHLLFADEFAFVPDNIIEPFYKSVYPTLSSSKISRMIISSTANGFNKFHSIYDGATKGLNEFKPIRIDWWEVPGRDENWKAREIANLGSEEAFNQEYGNEFLDENNLLLSFDTIKKLNAFKLDYVWKKIPELEKLEIDYNSLIWHPGYKFPGKNEEVDKYVISVDVAEGIGGDYTVMNIFKLDVMSNNDIEKLQTYLDEQDFFKLKQIAIYRNNKTDIREISIILNNLVYAVLGAENCNVILEMNRGDAVYLYEKLREIEDYYDGLVLNTKIFDGEKYKNRVGVILSHDSKLKYCRDFKNYLNDGKYEITDSFTINEFNNFGIVKNSYAALTGNDDCVMSVINTVPFFTNDSLSEFVSDMYDNLSAEKIKLINEKLNTEMLIKSSLNDDIDYSIVKEFN